MGDLVGGAGGDASGDSSSQRSARPSVSEAPNRASPRSTSNTTRGPSVVVTPAGYPRVHDMLMAIGARVVTVDTSEFRKMDGGLTCLSLRF